LKGAYLKHIKYIFRADLKPKKALKFVNYLTTIIGATKTFIKFIDLSPGFDIICGLKESHIALSYWGELGLCIMDIFSCKDFNREAVSVHIKKILDVEKVLETVLLDASVFTLIRKLNG